MHGGGGSWAVTPTTGHATPASAPCRHTKELIDNLVPVMKKHKVALYVNGHDHCMQVIRKDGITYVTSGAGSKASDTHEATRARVACTCLTRDGCS